MYSQNNEEEIILDYFSSTIKGNCLDIGAHDGKSLSNTRALLELGWHGVLVEPSPFVFPALVENCKGFDVLLIQCAVVPRDGGFIKFYDTAGDFISTTEGAATQSHINKWGKESFKHEFYVAAFTPEGMDICVGKTHYNFINIDVEGHNFQLFCEMLKWFSPELWCIEYDSYLKEIRAIARQYGYHNELLLNGENVILSK